MTRLVAEITESPLKGFWNAPGYDEMAIEGLHRNSHFRCFKSHHIYEKLFVSFEIPHKVIYIVRDPRDVIVSSIHYFTDVCVFRSNLLFARFINLLYKHIFGKILIKKRMLGAVLYGNELVSVWNKLSRKVHDSTYFNCEDCLLVKYEDLLNNLYMKQTEL